MSRRRRVRGGEEESKRWRGVGEEKRSMSRRWRGGGEEKKSMSRRWRGVGEEKRRWRGGE